MTNLPQRFVKTDVPRAGRCGHRPLQTGYGFALVRPCLWVHTAGRTGSSAPTGACRFALACAILRRCTAGRGKPLPYVTTKRATSQNVLPFSSSGASRHLPHMGKALDTASPGRCVCRGFAYLVLLKSLTVARGATLVGSRFTRSQGSFWSILYSSSIAHAPRRSLSNVIVLSGGSR